MKNYINWLLNFFVHNSFYVILFFSFLAGFSLLIAYIAEYFFKITPCKLCMYSRIPFWVLTLLPLFFLIPFLKERAFFGFFIILITILSSVSLSFYHVGVENHWFKPSLCKFDLSSNSSKKYEGGLYDFLLGDEQKLSSCENPEFKFFGFLTFAGLNLIFSSLLFVLINFFIFHKFLIKFLDLGGR